MKSRKYIEDLIGFSRKRSEQPVHKENSAMDSLFCFRSLWILNELLAHLLEHPDLNREGSGFCRKLSGSSQASIST